MKANKQKIKEMEMKNRQAIADENAENYTQQHPPQRQPSFRNQQGTLSNQPVVPRLHLHLLVTHFSSMHCLHCLQKEGGQAHTQKGSECGDHDPGFKTNKNFGRVPQ